LILGKGYYIVMVMWWCGREGEGMIEGKVSGCRLCLEETMAMAHGWVDSEGMI
jgi:hypothetical protein